MAADGGKFQKLAAEASGRGRPERRGFDRPTGQPSKSENLVCKTYSNYKSSRLHRSCVREFCTNTSVKHR